MAFDLEVLEDPLTLAAPLARLLGQCGIVLFICQVALGFRSATSLLTPDVLAINRAHQLLGRYGMLLVLAHPLLLFIATRGGVVEAVAPRYGDWASTIPTLGPVALALLIAIWASSVFGRTRLGFRAWRRIHLVAYVAVAFAFVHSLGGSSFESGIARDVWLGVGACGAAVMLGRTLHAAGVGQRRYRVVRVEDVARGVRRIVLTPIGASIRPAPGQFVYVQLKPFGEAHPFTASHFDAATGELSITPKSVGPFSRRLHALNEDDGVLISGPFGVFTREADTTDRPVVLMAGGIGITPFLAAIEARATARHRAGPMTLFYANRTPADAAFRAELDAIAATDPSLKVVHVFSEVPPCQGRLDERLLRAHLPHPPDAGEYFICGPPPMMAAMTSMLERLGTPRSRIHSERFGV
jgi:ferredoxin-NADP reductase/DMSO/TMAO reductase YedYZ heme-binding membrane subunit